MYEALTDRFRREIVRVVHEHEAECLTVAQLVRHIERLYGDPGVDIRTVLDHVHLPKLVDVGFIEYDRRSGVVRAGDSGFLDGLLTADVVECGSCARNDVRLER